MLRALVFALLSGCATSPHSVAEHRSSLATSSVDVGALAYVDAGPKDGEVIVLVHGIPTSSYLYRNIIPTLVAKGYRVVAPDLVGFGASVKPEGEEAYDFKKQSRRLFTLLDALGIRRFSLVVHDLGGFVAFESLDTDATRIERLLVLDTTAYLDGFSPPSEMRALGGWRGGIMSAMMSGSLLGRQLTGSFIRDHVAYPERIDDAAIDNYWWPIHEGTTMPMRAVARSFDAIMAEFPRYQAALRKFEGPAMLLWGKKDEVLDFAKISRQFARDLRISPEHVRGIDDAGHFLQEDHPEIVAHTIVELMSLAPHGS